MLAFSFSQFPRVFSDLDTDGNLKNISYYDVILAYHVLSRVHHLGNHKAITIRSRGDPRERIDSRQSREMKTSCEKRAFTISYNDHILVSFTLMKQEIVL